MFSTELDEHAAQPTETSSMAPYDTVPVNNIYMSGQGGSPFQGSQDRPSYLNNTSISFDLLNTNASNVKTRYDVKSLSNSSLYGSRVILEHKYFEMKKYIYILICFLFI